MPGLLYGALGALAAVTLFRFARWRHYAHHMHHGGHGGHGGHGHWQHGRGWHPEWMLRRLFVQLDTTHGQEKVINEAIEDLGARGKEMYSELEQLRKEIGRGLRGSQFDAEPVRESFARQRALVLALEEALIEHLQKVHGALDEKQRSALAELIQDGPRRSMHRHGCGWAGHHGRMHHRAC